MARPRLGLWIRVNTDRAGRHAISVELDEALGQPNYIGWHVADGVLTLWHARSSAWDAVKLTRPRNGHVRQFRSRKLARLVPPGRYEAEIVDEGRVEIFL